MTLGRLDIVYIVCITVVILFAVAFIAISALYFNSKKKLYVNLLEDPRIRLDVRKDLKSLKRKYGEGEEVLKGLYRRQKREKKASRVFSCILLGLYVVLLGVVGFSVGIQQKGGQFFVGDNALLVIQTDSMSEVYSGNESYLKENGVLDSDNRIAQFDLISLSRVQSESDIAPFKVYGFKMASKEEGKTVTIVHRLIDVKEVDGERRYTFRGDANSSSMVGEINLSFEDIVGEWTGYRSLALGMFVVYLQSGIGIVTLLTAFLLLIVYSVLYSKSAEQYEIRYAALIREELGLLPLSTQKEAQRPIQEDQRAVTLPLLNEERPVVDGKEEPSECSQDAPHSPARNVFSKPKKALLAFRTAQADFYLEQNGKKKPLSLVSRSEGGATYAYFASLERGSFRIIGKDGKVPFSKKGYDCFVSFRDDDALFKVVSPKASLLSKDGIAYYFVSERTSFEAIEGKETFLTLSLRKMGEKDFPSPSSLTPLFAVEKRKKEGGL